MAASLKASAYPALGISYAVSRQWLLTQILGKHLCCSCRTCSALHGTRCLRCGVSRSQLTDCIWVAGMMLKCMLIPIYWFSDSLVQRQHDRLYSDVLASKQITVSLEAT